MALILVVEDEAILRPLIEEMLNQGGYGVVTVGSGKEAINLCQEQPVDLVITDLGLPDMDGLEVIRSLRGSHPDLPIVAMSGTVGGTSLARASQLGAIAALQKPFDYGELLAVVGKILNKERSNWKSG